MHVSMVALVGSGVFWGTTGVMTLYRWSASTERLASNHPSWTRVLPLVALNHALTYCMVYWMEPRLSELDENPSPTLLGTLQSLLFFLAVEEVLFYYVHRMLHTPLLFQYIHAVHHEFIAPVAIATTYAHPVEHLLCNVVPVLTGPFLLQPHRNILWAWIALATFSSVHAHAGIPSSKTHDNHHRLFRVNYGVLGVLDWMHGTQAHRLRSK